MIKSWSIKCIGVLLSLSFLTLSAQEPDSVKNRKSLAFFPVLSYAPETSLTFGALAVWVIKTDEIQGGFQRQSTLSPYFLYTLQNQIITTANLNFYFPNGDNLINATRFFKYPDFYYGIGNDNDPDVSESYTNVFFRTEGQYLKPINTKSFFGVAFDLHFTSLRDVVDGGMLETDNVIGLDGGNLLGAGPAYRYDTRNNTLYPSNGYLITIQSTLTYLGDFNYTSHLADFRKYISLWNDKNILAFQFKANFTSGKDIPFYKLPQLSGDERLRGFANASLYRDRQMMYTQVEYRRPLFWRFGMVVFAGVGDVAYGLSDFSFARLKYAAGMGGRLALIPERKLNARLDLGIGQGGQYGIYLGLSEAF